MPFQVVPDVCEVTMVFSRGTGPGAEDWPVINRHHWRDTVAGWGDAQQSALRDEISAWWTAELQALTSSNLILYSIQTRDLGDEFGASGELVVNEAGSVATTTILPVLSALIKWQCDGGSAPRRGLTYFGGMVEGNISGDSIDATYLGNLVDAYDALRAVNGVGTAAMVIVSRYLNGALRAEGVSNTIASVTGRAVVAVQERRRR